MIVDDPYVSRRHLTISLRDDGVHVADQRSTAGTLARGLPITTLRIATRPEVLQLAGAEILVVPPGDGSLTRSRRNLRLRQPMLRVKLVTLCRDHLIPPYGRGAWVLRAKDLAEILAVDGSPNEATLTKDLANIKGLVGVSGATTEELIDWAVASREVTAADAVDLDEYLLRERGATYDELVLRTTRAATLQYLLRRTSG